MEGLSVGRIVHYFNPDFGEVTPRAAMIVRVWGDNGTVNLRVFLDGSNDKAIPEWQTSVQHISQFPDPANQPRVYWDWPARA